ncbi:type IV pili methyl-accepting chemotaxis transducer N-terminal domain-containing protein [Flavobacteriaceae bacterium]|nr:type IV pili methyl-accepting chemotaxis transducer N-terminal domain-containing protein [Flavobacteriaceae bacterium]
MKNVLKSVLLLSFHVVFSQNVTVSQAINIIGKEAMLTQRMAKDKVFLSNNVENQTSKKELISSVILFERNLDILKNTTLTTEIQNDLTHLELLWVGYKQNINTTDTNNNDKVAEYNNIMLSLCEKVNIGLLKTAELNGEYPYNVTNKTFTEATISSNKLKGLSQRLALFYSTYFFKEKKYDGDQFKSIISEIDSNVAKIKTAENIDLNIKQSTEDVIFQWKNIKAILQNVTTNDFISVHSSPKTDIIFEECNKLLHYSDLLTRTYKSTNDINKI